MAMEERYETISSLDAHRQTLSKAIELAKSRVIICSAGISIAAIRKDRLGDLIQDAVARGVEVIIYTDTTLDLDKGTQEIREVARLGREALVAAGADLRIVNRIHNKSLAVDKTLIVEGSFNWLSAIRNTDHEFQKLERSFLVQGPRAKLPIEELLLQLAYHHQL